MARMADEFIGIMAILSFYKFFSHARNKSPCNPHPQIERGFWQWNKRTAHGKSFHG
jgi:hypothetical protein